MKKRKVLILCFLIMIVIVGVIFIIYQSKERNKLSVNAIVDQDCEEKKHYFDYEGRKVYLACVNSVTINKNNKNYDLKYALDNKIIDFYDILSIAKNKEEYWDGGSIIYRYDDFTIVVYQRYAGNQNVCDDIIIGNNKIEIGNYCN